MSDEAAPAPAAAEPSLPAALGPALARFERGDFRGARARLAALRAGAPTAEEAEAAAALERRMAADPWTLRIGVAVLAVLALVAGLYLL